MLAAEAGGGGGVGPHRGTNVLYASPHRIFSLNPPSPLLGHTTLVCGVEGLFLAMGWLAVFIVVCVVMDTLKRELLELCGWEFGDAADFLGMCECERLSLDRADLLAFLGGCEESDFSGE